MGRKMSKLNSMIVVARKDGRGGVRPFGKYNKSQAGATVTIMDKEYRVTSDGRVNIPKAVMNKGRGGKDGRMRIEIQFATKSVLLSGREDYWNKVIATVRKPVPEYADVNQGYRVRQSTINDDEIFESAEFNEYSFT